MHTIMNFYYKYHARKMFSIRLETETRVTTGHGLILKLYHKDLELLKNRVAQARSQGGGGAVAPPPPQMPKKWGREKEKRKIKLRVCM